MGETAHTEIQIVSAHTRTHPKTHIKQHTKTYTVSVELAASLVSLRPQIVHHACHSGKTGCFGDCILGALLPHAVEHIAIDLLVERFADPDSHTSQTFAGATTWLERDAARMRVRVGCTSDNPVLYFTATETALIDAVHLINRLLTAEDDDN